MTPEEYAALPHVDRVRWTKDEVIRAIREGGDIQIPISITLLIERHIQVIQKGEKAWKQK